MFTTHPATSPVTGGRVSRIVGWQGARCYQECHFFLSISSSEWWQNVERSGWVEFCNYSSFSELFGAPTRLLESPPHWHKHGTFFCLLLLPGNAMTVVKFLLTLLLWPFATACMMPARRISKAVANCPGRCWSWQIPCWLSKQRKVLEGGFKKTCRSIKALKGR